MNKLFDPNTHKLFDTSTGKELNYDYLLPTRDRYDTRGMAYYRISPDNYHVYVIDSSIVSPSILTDILNNVTNSEFSTGFSLGLSDGMFHARRRTFLQQSYVSWSFLVGYEYGVQLGTYYKSLT